MASRRVRREYLNEKTKISSKNKKRLLLMLFSIVLMIFCVFQVYYLARYTLGKEVSSSNLKVYKWVRMLVDGTEEDTSDN